MKSVAVQIALPILLKSALVLLFGAHEKDLKPDPQR